MSRRDDVVNLQDMLDHAREAVELLGDASRKDLAGNRILQLALTRLVEMIAPYKGRGCGPCCCPCGMLVLSEKS